MEPNASRYLKLLSQVESFIHSPETSEDDFDSLAQKLFQHQLANNPAYRNFCQLQKIDSIHHWQEFPALTTDTFKSKSPPTCLNLNENLVHFQTSGTTGDIKGTHYFRQTQTYELSILQAWQQLELPSLDGHVYFLTPSAREAPLSSLSHMMETLRQKFCPQASYLISDDQLNIAPLLEATKQPQPIALLGTALAFLNLFEQLHSPLTLPAGSWAMETGGYKGSGRSLTKQDLYGQFYKYLGLTKQSIWNEYSMTELSSQFYTKGIDDPHQAPHWAKIRVIDPETDKDVQAGEIGYLVIYDLANIDSICAIRTQDLAIYHHEHSFTLIGRDPSALPRGCSRSIDSSLNN
ncbi:hypothetical protein ACFPK9_13665 [Rubritalea spongiae]|uniref:Acyl-protein synthetase LuxE domain-containing protein n=1 Tax=Rubritalea spongiae TaxID=430797 RepID=A0ABW5E516_9BACT